MEIMTDCFKDKKDIEEPSDLEMTTAICDDEVSLHNYFKINISE